MAERLKILMVSNGFFPEISPRSYRATDLAKEFCRQGHIVRVITKHRDFDYSEFLSECSLDLTMWGKSRLKSIPELKNKSMRFLVGIVKRILQVFFEYPGIEDMFKVKKVLEGEKNYDCLISFAVPYPVHWGVAWSRTSNHRIAKTWIADCGDPYMGDVIDTFRKPFYFKYLEKSFCRKAEYLTVPIKEAINGYYPEFQDKIHVIPQGLYFDLRHIFREPKNNTCPTFAYAGGFISGIRDPGQLLRFLSGLALPFKFFVFTNQPEFLNDFRKALGEKLIISSYIPRNDLINVLSNVDFLINFDNNTNLNSPSKLIDYAIADRPVLNITKDFNGESLLEFLGRDYRKKMVMPDPWQFHIKNVAEQFLELVKNRKSE